MVDVTDRSDVDVRLGPLELGLSHLGPPQDVVRGTWLGRAFWDLVMLPGL